MKHNWFPFHHHFRFDQLSHNTIHSLIPTLTTWSYSEQLSMQYWRASTVQICFFFENFTLHCKVVYPIALKTGFAKCKTQLSFGFMPQSTKLARTSSSPCWNLFLDLKLILFTLLGIKARDCYLAFLESLCILVNLDISLSAIRLLLAGLVSLRLYEHEVLMLQKNYTFRSEFESRNNLFVNFLFFVFTCMEDVTLVRLICFLYRVFV